MKMRQGFTIIEILVSVLIISVSILYILRIYNNNKEHILYIVERNKHALNDSLFLGKEILRYHQDTKNAFELLHPALRIDELESRELLKKIERKIYLPDEVIITPPPDTPGPSAVVNEVKLNGEYPAYYWHFRITSF